METQRINISDLACDPANVRAHDGKNLDAIKASLQRFGQQKPIVVDEKGIVIAGNGTLTAARALGWDAINVVRTELAGAEATAYAIADNRTAELAEWDDEALAKQLSALQIEDEALVEAAGFSDAELTALVDEVMGITEGNTDPDEVPEVPEEPTAQAGQIWRLGNHRLMCGDSTSAEDVAALMDGQKADMVFTDPPYGMNLNTEYSAMHKKAGYNSAVGGKNYPKVRGDGEDFEPILIETIFNNFEHCKEIFLWGADYYREIIPKKTGSWVVWDKRSSDNHDNLDKLIGSSFELCWSKEKHKRDIARVLWAGHHGMNADDTRKRVHPTQKPVALALWFFDRWGSADDIVADLYLGSGSTLLACEQTGRKCYGMELSPAYCDVIIKRWEDFTGQTAELVDG